MTDINSPQRTSPEPGLTRRVAHGAAWIMGSGIAARALGAINTIVVARLLIPNDIGIVAVATLAMQLLQGFSDVGVSQAVVRFRDAGRDDLNTLFTLSLARGLLVGLALALAAPVMAAFYDDPRMRNVFLAVALAPVMIGLINPRFFEFERELKFSQQFLVTIATKLAGVIVSVVIAFMFRTYWAIILGMLAGGAVQLFLSYALRPFAPRLSFKSIRKVFGFSGWLTAVSFVAALNNKLDTPILARFVGTGGAGIFFMGGQLSDMVAEQLAAPLSKAVYPGLSSLQDEVDRMRKAFLRSVAALGVIAMPAAFGFAFVAEDATALVLGEKWAGVAPVIKVLAPVAGLQSLFYAAQYYAMALGLTRLVFIRESAFFLIRFPVFIWAVAAHGLNGAIWAAAGTGVLHVILNLALYARAGGGKFWEPLWSARRSFGAVAVMALWFLWLRPEVAPIDALPLASRLIADIAMGAAIYGLALTGLWIGEGRPDGVERQIWRTARAFTKH
ncbi:MAG: lipopolysaccharide biosynthesis protein [Pseudomonadota bacterium]